MKKKLLVAIGIITTILLLTILQGKVNAATLQSNPNTHYKTTSGAGKWITNIRQMEATGGAMGLSETVNTDQTFKEESNNIDVHMMRNTEYGAIAILSVSGYGNSKTIPNSTIKSTTGNETGVYYTTGNNNYELVAAGYSGQVFTKINSRYYDAYGSNKIGDALDLKWQGATNNTGLNPSSLYVFLGRNNGGRYFGYSSWRADISNPAYSRGVAVCGTGF